MADHVRAMDNEILASIQCNFYSYYGKAWICEVLPLNKITISKF